MKYIFLIATLFTLFDSWSQRAMTLEVASTNLQKNNLYLIAEQMNVSVSEAKLIQAKIWELPYFSAEFNAINPNEGRYFDIGKAGQKSAEIQQLIYLGGKKQHEIAFAKSNVAIAQLQFESVTRNLQNQLAETFYSIYYDQQKVKAIDDQIGKLDTLLSHYKIQVTKGNLPLRDVVRLQTFVLNLKNEKNGLNQALINSQHQFQLLTGTQEAIIPVFDEDQVFDKYLKTSISKNDLQEKALKSNLDYLIMQQLLSSQELYLSWQKSLKIPDLTAGISYDQRGGAFNNQINFTLGIPIPAWNMNKGNIQVAEIQKQQLQSQTDYGKMELINKVDMLWESWQNQKNQLENIQGSMGEDLKSVYEGMLINFQRNNISMLEFTDFMESYNLTNLQLNEIKKSWILASIRLNHIANLEVF